MGMKQPFFSPLASSDMLRNGAAFLMGKEQPFYWEGHGFLGRRRQTTYSLQVSLHLSVVFLSAYGNAVVSSG